MSSSLDGASVLFSFHETICPLWNRYGFRYGALRREKLVVDPAQIGQPHRTSVSRDPGLIGVVKEEAALQLRARRRSSEVPKRAAVSFIVNVVDI